MALCAYVDPSPISVPACSAGWPVWEYLPRRSEAVFDDAHRRGAARRRPRFATCHGLDDRRRTLPVVERASVLRYRAGKIGFEAVRHAAVRFSLDPSSRGAIFDAAMTSVHGEGVSRGSRRLRLLDDQAAGRRGRRARQSDLGDARKTSDAAAFVRTGSRHRAVDSQSRTGRIERPLPVHRPASFFESLPPGADAYMLKHIIHDWSDEESVKITRNCRRAIGTNAAGRARSRDGDPAGQRPDVRQVARSEHAGDSRWPRTDRKRIPRTIFRGGISAGRIVPTATEISVIEEVPV